MHNSFILQQYVCYTTILNMFRVARCSSSGGQIVSPQPLVSSPSVNSRTVCRWRADCITLSTYKLYGCLQRVTIPEAVVIQFVLLRMSSVLLETCCWRIKELYINLVIWKKVVTFVKDLWALFIFCFCSAFYPRDMNMYLVFRQVCLVAELK